MIEHNSGVKIIFIILLMLVFIGVLSYITVLISTPKKTMIPTIYATPAIEPTAIPTVIPTNNPIKESENPFNTGSKFENPFSATSSSYQNPF